MSRPASNPLHAGTDPQVGGLQNGHMGERFIADHIISSTSHWLFFLVSKADNLKDLASAENESTTPLDGSRVKSQKGQKTTT